MDAKKILGVGPNATSEEIQKAYREKVRKHHPDMGGDAWAFQQVQEAYEELTNTSGTKSKSSSKTGTPTASNAAPSDRRPKSSRPNRQAQSQTKGSAKTQRNRKTNSRSPNAKPIGDERFENRKWWQMFTGELPLQSLTFYFILVNCLDIFWTHKLMQNGAIEANPIANYFFKLWNFNGMIAFKLVTVAMVCVIAQIIALKRIQTARVLLIFGSIAVGCVVVYSGWLFYTRFR